MPTPADELRAKSGRCPGWRCRKAARLSPPHPSTRQCRPGASKNWISRLLCAQPASRRTMPASCRRCLMRAGARRGRSSRKPA